MPLSVGETFAGYTIVRLIGSGGMGEVYLARHPRLPRDDALKVLRPDNSSDEEFRQRFIREADLASALKHPNIVTVHDRGEFGGQLWIATEYVEGTDAAQLLRSRYPAGMPIEEASNVVTAIASALDYAHDRGLLHRDVKPANILVSRPSSSSEQHIYLADFGIARPLANPNGLTATNLTVGTVAYAAPEQLMGEDMGGQADQYALAATAFNLLTGAPVFDASNPVIAISKQLTTPAPRISGRRADLASLDDVFSTALAKHPTDRFATCGQFATALRTAVGTNATNQGTTQAAMTIASTPAHQLNAKPQVPEKKGMPLRRAITLVAALSAVGTLVAVAIFLFHNANLGPKPNSPVAGPTLDGTYHLAYDNARTTYNGAVAAAPKDSAPMTSWWAFRSICTATGCVATGTLLNKKNAQEAANPTTTTVLHFADGNWRETPWSEQQEDAKCLGVDGTVVPGSFTLTGNLTMEPKVDGTLRGVLHLTDLTDECGSQGRMTDTPFVATRTGEVPPGINVADPAGIPSQATTRTAAQPVVGPTFEGTYRQELQYGEQTANGRPTIGSAEVETNYWAFRSLCESTKCVATAVRLVNDNQAAPQGASMVLFFTEGKWQSPPLISQLRSRCKQPGDPASEVTTTSSLYPQKDGTLRGTEILKVLDNQCGNQGMIFETPMVFTRTGDVSPTVTLADPALFF